MAMQFEEQTAAQRQMKELLRDQAKFRERLDRVVRKIETSSERTAKLAERRKGRKPAAQAQQAEDGHDRDEQHEHVGSSPRREPVTLSPEKESP